VNPGSLRLQHRQPRCAPKTLMAHGK
jgi:hypothetical protein